MFARITNSNVVVNALGIDDEKIIDWSYATHDTETYYIVAFATLEEIAIRVKEKFGLTFKATITIGE